MKRFLNIVTSILLIFVLLSACNMNQSSQDNTENRNNKKEAKKKPPKQSGGQVSKQEGRIYFMRDSFIFSANPDGSDVQQLSDTGKGKNPDSHPSVSDDGNYIVYSNFYRIYLIPSNGGEEIEVANHLQANNPVLSPDNLHVAYDMDYLGTLLVATSSTETYKFEKEYGRIYNPRGFPDWSPDGRKIVASELASNGSHFYLVLIDVETKEHQVITDDSQHSYFSASFSPDGSKLAVIRSKAEEDEYSLWLMNVDGTNGMELVQNVEHNRPAWSPDGKYIAFQMNGSIYYVPTIGGEAKLMIENAKAPAWGK